MNTKRKTPIPEPTLVFPKGFTLGGPFSRCRAVRLTKDAKRSDWAANSPQHITEFGSKHKRGTVLGQFTPTTQAFNSNPVQWSEYEVVWSFKDNRAPSNGRGLSYLYRPSDLEGV